MEKLNPSNVLVDFNLGKPKLRDIHKGETCIIVANGPSLADVPLEFLEKYPTFGVNNIYLREDFNPTYYTILGIDQLDNEEKRGYCRPTIEKATNAFVNRIAYPFFDLPHVYAIHSVDLITRKKPEPKKFSKNPLRRIGIGSTNIYISLQLAHWMGFTTILCVGLDNDYGADPEKLHFYKNDKRYACEPFMGRAEHQVGSNLMFQLAKEAFEGREIININETNNTVFDWSRPEQYW